LEQTTKLNLTQHLAKFHSMSVLELCRPIPWG